MTVSRSPKVEKKQEYPIRWAAALCLLTLVVFANTFSLGFALDAVGVVQGDPRVHAATAQNLALIFQNDYWWPSSVDSLYRPVTTLSFLLNYAVLGNGENAAGYHVLNVLLHLANVLLVFQLVRLLLRDKKVSFFVAAIWAVHPIVTESVANVAGRADLLATLAVLGGLLLYARLLTKATGWLSQAAALFGLALLGVLSKESAAVVLGLMLLWDLAAGEGWRGGGTRRAVAYGAVGGAILVMLLLRHAVFAAAPVGETPFVDNPLRGAGFWVARWTAVKMLGLDLLLLVWPLRLASERGFDQIRLAGAGDPWAWVSLAVAVAVLAAVMLRYRRDRVLFFAAGLFAIALLPVSNLVLLIGATLAERFLYLPSIGFALALVVLLGRLKMRSTVLPALILTLFAGRTFARNGDWNDNLTLARADVASAPESARIRELLATSLFAQDPVRNLDAAIQAGESAWAILRVLPPADIYQQTPARLGAYYRIKGDTVGPPGNQEWYAKSLSVLLRAREASQAIERAYDGSQLTHHKPLATRVAYQPLYIDLGLVLMRLQRPEEAIEAYRYGRELDPRTGSLYDLLADAYAARRDRNGVAIALLGKTLLLGSTAESMAQLTRVYGENSCVIERGNGWVRLNEGCPAVQADLCRAWSDLAELLGKARLTEAAAEFARRGVGRGCPSTK